MDGVRARVRVRASFVSELCWRKAVVAYTEPQKGSERKKKMKGQALKPNMDAF